MDPSVESACGLLIRSRLLSAEDVQGLVQRWRRGGQAAGDAGQFYKWLVAHRWLTEYQATLLTRGHADHFFLGPYKILDRVGKGRMAGVYQAVHHLGQMVAIKVLPPSKAKDPQTLARFRRESRLALRLKHPNVVRTFQTGVQGDLHYLVMEYLEGETFEEVLERRGKLPPVEAVHVVHQALLGLQHIHEQGLVHRDLKAGNLMLVPAEPGRPESTLQTKVKILDIGLGRALFDETTPEAGPQRDLTAEGAVLGTVEYLAPEQARNPHAVDIRADLYSLGCVLYHALTGRPPFPDTSPVQQMIRHATEKAPPVKDFNPAVPDRLAQLVESLMEKEPDRRPATPERAARSLQAFLPAAAAPARVAEVESRLQAFLDWLESSDHAAPIAESAPAPPKRAEPPPPPRPARPASPPGGRAAVLRSVPAPAERPAAPDIELVPTVPAARPAPGPAPGLRLSRRETLILAAGVGLGAAGVVLAEVVGWLIARLLRRTPPEAETTRAESAGEGERRRASRVATGPAGR